MFNQSSVSSTLTSMSSLSSTSSSSNENQKLKISNTETNRRLLYPHISALSEKVQKDNNKKTNETNHKNNRDLVLLKLENEALDHISYLVLDVFDSILLASTSIILPENACALVMSDSITNRSKTVIYPISNLIEAELRVKQALPKAYCYESVSKALSIVEKCRSMKKKRFFNTFNSSSPFSFLNSSQVSSSSNDSNNNLPYTFSFPLNLFESILFELDTTIKVDIYVVIFLVAILEHITKDILRLSTTYSSCLNKYSISKRDISTSIQGDSKLTKLFYSTSNNSSLNYSNNDSLFDDFDSSDVNEDFDDEYRIGHGQIEFELGRFTIDRTGHDILLKQFQNKQPFYADTESVVSLPPLNNLNDSSISPSNTEECTSDSSTICPDSITYENLNLKYSSKVKELILEQQQHLSDLNILRRIFMYLFQKFSSEDCHASIEKIFGNINEVYECALRLYDLLDDAYSAYLSNQQQLKEDQDLSSQQTYQPLLIGQQFWELAEGDEFEVYFKYAINVNNYELIKSSLHNLLNNPYIYKNLQQTSQGLVEISKYLLPKLLFGPVHHFLYLYETINCQLQLSFDEEDKIFLNDTLDTLKSTKFKLNELGFNSSKKRPIETSFRIFQSHQFQTTNKTNSMNSSVCSIGQASNFSTLTSSKTPALAHNICSLTERKWKEIEQNVDSLKLPTYIYQAHQPQILVETLSQSKSVNNLINGSNLRYAYLYEGSLQICKTSQQFPVGQTNNLKNALISQSKFKISKRYAYLFDGLLLLVKKQQTTLLNTNLTSNAKSFRFKEAIQLDKCYIRDREDELCFEIQIQSDIDQTLLNQSQSEQNQGQEFIIFMADSANEKYQYMSMLCYSQYKLTIDRLLQQMTEEQNKNNPLPIPPKGYIFDQPDSPDTILFEQPNKSYDLDKNNPKLPLYNPYSNSDGLAIKAATLIKLVERLTHHLYIHPKFSPTFLMFFREFSTPKELLSLLSIRYDVPNLDLNEIKDRYNFTSGGITERELLKRYRREYQQPIRLKVINLIKHWIEGYYNDDFADNPDLLIDLRVLIEKIGKTNKRFEQVLTKTLQKKANIYQEKQVLKQQSQQISDVFISKHEDTSNGYNSLKNIFKKKISSSASSNSSLSNQSVSSRSSSTSTNEDTSNENQDFNENLYPPFETHLEHLHPYDILTIHPLEFARQATLMEEELFKAIKPNELITLGWNKPDQKYKLSPNVSKLSNLSNKFTYWYVKCVVDTQNLDERVAVVQRLLDIAHYFYQLNNFSGLKEIYAAFETSWTARLKITREKSGLEQHKMYSKFKQLFDNHDQGYLERLKKCSPPCIPFIGTHLSNILKTHEFNKINIDNQKSHILQQQQKFSTKNEVNDQSSDELNNQNETCTSQQSNLINFSKYRLLVEFVNDLLQYQNVSYKFRVNHKIRSFLLEDIENYFEAAQHALENSDEFKNPDLKTIETSSSFNPTQIVESWLFDKSKHIEPNDVNKFPRIRKYSLKSPPVSNRINAKQVNTAKQNDSPRSQSATRLEKKTQSSQIKSNQFVNLTLKNSSTSIGKLSTSSNVKTINNSKTSYNIGNQKEEAVPHKRSNSQSQYKPQLDLVESNNSSSLVFPTANMSSSSNSTNIAPFNLTTGATSSSSSSTLATIQLSQTPELPTTNPSYMASLAYTMGNSKKLSVSSADSSSSAPNSPPPNYDEVFDSATVCSVFPLVSNSITGQQQIHQQEKCFDNRTYYQRSSASTTKPIQQITTEPNSTSSSFSGSSIISSTQRNQKSVFSFDLTEKSDILSLSIDQISPILLNSNLPTPPQVPPRTNPSPSLLASSEILNNSSHGSSYNVKGQAQAPSHRPPSPPSQPPPINRQNKPALANVSNKSPSSLSPAAVPPPLPPSVPSRPLKNKP